MMKRKAPPRRLPVFLLPALACLVFSGCENAVSGQPAAGSAFTMSGLFNFRDMGGYEAAEGRIIRHNLIYRSDELTGLSDPDIRILEWMGIKTVVDFRTPSEKASNGPDILPKGARLVEIPIAAGDLNYTAAAARNTEGNTAYMISLYSSGAGVGPNDSPTNLVEHYLAEYGQFFRILADPANLPLVFHCSAGKDRTGYAAALFLRLLGVNGEIVMQDYLLSAANVADKYEPIVKALKNIPMFANGDIGPLTTVKREYLEASINRIETGWDTVENYFTNKKSPSYPYAVIQAGLALNARELGALRSIYIK
ncbi:MAG: tyrosine-protein phosphatase [Treponema sp.]|nr:tyrosine-protein phosphatase [Treponema sp.]